MLLWSIETALSVFPNTQILVSTDSQEIKTVAEQTGLQVPFLRPAELSGDTSPTEPTLLHALEWQQKHRSPVDAVILLQPTSPFRKPGTLERAITHFESSGGNSLVSVTSNHSFFWRNMNEAEALYDFENRPRRQDLNDQSRWYRENGSIYITDSKVLIKHRNRLGGRICMFEMSEEESWEIDTLQDLIIVEALMQSIPQVLI